MSPLNSAGHRQLFRIISLASLLLLSSSLWGQATISTGNMVGDVLDPSGSRSCTRHYV